jgi:CRP-like cAMP-binding protein
LENLIQLFNSISLLSIKSIKLLKEHLSLELIPKNKTFSEQGLICKKLSFVNRGVLKVLKINENGNEFIPYFITSNHFAVDIESFSNKSISTESIETITDCELVTITDFTYAIFEDQIPNFSKIINILKEKALIEKMKLKNEMLVDNALTRYKKFQNKNPYLLQQIPQSQIALHLGITQYTLSRIKSKC